MSTLREYIKENHPNILEEYTRAKKGKQILKRGMWVKTLVSGFGGPAGKCCQFIREVKAGDPTGDGSTWGDDYLCFGYINEYDQEDIRWATSPNEWHREIEILKDWQA
jgi:hypothetical protein